MDVIKGSLFDCFASYIEGDYEDLDLRVKPIEEQKNKMFLQVFAMIKLNMKKI